MDLVDVGKHKRDNGGIYWILTAIDTKSIRLRYSILQKGHKQYDQSGDSAIEAVEVPIR